MTLMNPTGRTAGPATADVLRSLAEPGRVLDTMDSRPGRIPAAAARSVPR
jgi:hypothetical protein